MSDQTRQQVMSRLKNAPGAVALPPRPRIAPLREESMDKGELIERFREHLEAQTGVLKRACGNEGVLQALEQVFEEEGISKAVFSADSAVVELGLRAWGKENGCELVDYRDCGDKTAFKKTVFAEVDAGITGADFGFAESGTLCLLAGEDMPRLISLAPIVHIAVLPVDRLVPTYEHMVRKVFQATPPSQVILITGPSATADIQATPFKGMHGPRRLIVIIKED